MRVYKFKYVFLFLIAFGFTWQTAEVYASELAPRKMLFYENQELNIRFRHYEDPDWDWSIDRSRRYKTLIIESPDKFYPVTLFEITPFGDSNVKQEALQAVAKSAMQRARSVYRLAPEVSDEQMEAKTWGTLSGYQISFDANVQKEDMSVLYFVGTDVDGRIVSMTATTQKGKLGHIKEHIRRTFNWIQYLSPRELKDYSEKVDQ